MDKTVRGLVRLSVALRNISTLPNYVVLTRFVRTAPPCYFTSDNDFLSTPSRSALLKKDKLLSSLRHSMEIKEVLHIVDVNQSMMQKQHVLQALRSLFSIHKLQSDSVKRTEILNSLKFLKLCELLERNIRSLDINEAVDALKMLTYFRVRSKSKIMESLLQLIRHSINQLSLEDIMFVENLMQNYESTPLVKALQIALPIVFQAQLPSKLDKENTAQLARILHYLHKTSDNEEAISTVVTALLDCRHDVDVKSARLLVWTLCDLKHLSPGYLEVLSNAQDILAEGVTWWSYKEIDTMLNQVTAAVWKRRRPEFYHEAFMDACARAVIAQDHGFEEAIKVLRILNRIDHTQIRLLDYVAAKCFENPTLLKQCPPSMMMVLVDSLATADYKPIFWESMQQAVVDDNVLEVDQLYLPWIKFAVNLASLDCYCPKLLEKVFAKDFLNYHLSKGLSLVDRLQLLLLYQSVKTLYPGYNGPWPPMSVLESAMQLLRKKTEFPLQPALEKAVGGPQYVLTKLRTKVGHFIDHVVVMRKGGYPVAINSSTDLDRTEENCWTYIEELQVPPESQIMCIMNMRPNSYALNSQRLKGQWALALKSLESHTKHAIIPINSTMWISLPDHEKIPYLMQAIRLKCDDYSESTNLR